MKNKQSSKLSKFYNQVVASFCDVCFTQFKRQPAKKLNEGLQILVCTKCKCKTHKCCYDFEANEVFVSEKIRQFICNRCANPTTAKKQCFICHQSDGAMIVSDDNQVVHVFCAIYHNQIDINSYYPKIKAKRSYSYTPTEASCDVCKKPNAFQSCAFQNCKKHAHPYCVKKAYAEQELITDQPKGWNHHLTCVNNNIFDLSDEIIPFNLFKDSIQQQLSNVESIAPFELVNKEEIMKKQYDQYLIEGKKQKKNSKSIRRGGYSFISCPEHQYSPYCICTNQNSDDGMVGCDCCLAWYHMACIKYAQTESKQPFSCSFCRSFYELKRKIIDEVVNNKTDHYQIKCDFPAKISFMDLMWIIRVIDSRIARGNVSKMMKQLNKYPLRTSKMDKLIKIQNKNRLEIMCEEFYQQYFFSDSQFKIFKPFAVLGLDKDNKPIKLIENISKNQKLRDFIGELRNFCKRQGIVDEFKGIISELDFKQNALSDSYEKIIELSKSQQKYQEVPILKVKAQAYSFLQIVKKVNSGSIITINQLQQSVRKANLIQNVPDYLINPLIEKYNNTKTIIKNLYQKIQTDPYNIFQIKQICLKLTNQCKVEPPSFYEVYLQQRNFANSLYFYQAKQSGSQIQGEISLKQKLQQLIRKTCQPEFSCTQQLVKSLNNFIQIRQKHNKPQFIFSQLKKIIQNLQQKTIQFQFNDILTSKSLKTYKKQKLQYLFNKANQYHLKDNLIQELKLKYQKIKELFGSVVDIHLDNVFQFGKLSSLNQNIATLISILEEYPFKIQDVKNHKTVTLLQLAKHRKQEIHQLMLLSNQSHMEKNPLCLNKILDSLPKQNPLVKKFKQLKRQHQQLQTIFVNCLALSSQKMDYFKGQGLKKTRRQQISINSSKPDLNRMNEILQSLNHSKVDLSKQIKQVTRIINRSLDLSFSVQKYCKSKDNYEKCNSVEELSLSRKQIQDYRKKILSQTQIALTKELTILYHCEIHNRMRSNLVAGNFQLDKNSKLLKFAEQEEINTTETYQKLKEKFQSKNQKSKQINQIKNIESKLKSEIQKQTDPIYRNVYSLRKSLLIPDVQTQAPRIPYIQQLKQKNRQIKQKLTKALAQGSHPSIKLNFQQGKILCLDALKSPYSLSNLHYFYSQIQKAHQFYTNWKRSQSMGRNSLYNQDKLKEYQKLKFKIDEVQHSSKEVYKIRNSLKVLETVENILQETLNVINFAENTAIIQENMEIIQDNHSLSFDNQLFVLSKRKYLKIWYSIIKILKNNQQNNQNSEDQKQTIIIINFKKLKKLLYDSYYMLQNQLKSLSSRQQIIQELKQFILFYEQLMIQIKMEYLSSISYKKNNILNNWIDLDDIIYEIKVGASIQDTFFVYQPFDDLNKFKYRNLTHKNSDIITRVTKQQNAFKRHRPDDLNSQIKGDKLSKRPSHVSKSQQSEDSQLKINLNIVSQHSRKQIKQILSKNILKNQQLKKYGSCENQIKMIQNQIFGQYHNDLRKYLQSSEKFQKLFIKLQPCPEISKKMIAKSFQFKFIKLLVQNLGNIPNIQSMMVSKIKEEKNIQQFKNSLQVNTTVNKMDQQHNNNVLHMLSTGKVTDAFKKDLAKEVKKIKQGKDKKKKKHKHGRRSRSRSASPDAKFSQESEQEQLPSYIQKQYNLDEDVKQNFDILNPLELISGFNRNEQPLMFDPQMNETQIEDIEKKYPRGSVLKIKMANLQFFLKNKGKLQMKVHLFTQEDYKKVTSQLVDPGFTTLNIRKQKNDKQIIDYLNKPSKKKYKFLVTWIQGETTQQNQCLKQLSQQANERHKIYGWQNEHLKVHVMSIKQFVQISKFSSNIPNRTCLKSCVQMFDNERIICLVQYPAQKMYELKEKFKNFTQVQRIEPCYEVSIPLPTYDTYEPIQSQSLYYPKMGDVQISKTMSIKSMEFFDPLIKEAKNVEFQGWATNNTLQQTNRISYTPINSYDSIRIRMGFGGFSPILTDEQDNFVQKNQKIDIADSLLKSFQKKSAAYDMHLENQKAFQQGSYEKIRNQGQNRYNPQQAYGQQRTPKYYKNTMGPSNPMMGGQMMNPMNRQVNNPMGGYQVNRGYQQRNYNPMNRYNPNQGQFNNYQQGNQYNRNPNIQHGNGPQMFSRSGGDNMNSNYPVPHQVHQQTSEFPLSPQDYQQRNRYPPKGFQ